MTDEEMRAVEAEMPLRMFAVHASPAFWLDYAEELYESATTLIESDRDRRIARRDPVRGTSVQSPHSRAYLLLAAFSVENVLKGIAVAHDPQLVANGELAPALRSHGLLSIARDVAKITLDDRQRRTCGVLESAIPTWGRYPVALKASTVVREASHSDQLEREVAALFRALVAMLRELLTHAWNGPHGAVVISGTVPQKDAEPSGPAS
jgi:hypothetical protein